jgi:hypothetical protein
VTKATQHPSIGSIFEQLFCVFAIHTLRNESADFIQVRISIFKQVFISLFVLIVEIVVS